MNVSLTSIDPVLLIEDICKLLRIKRSQFYALRPFFEQHKLLVEVQPKLDARIRYSGEPFRRLLSDSYQAKLFRQAMQEVEKFADRNETA
jgi:hypothetical protein